MPQFELENVGPGKFSGLVRGRSAEEAVRGVVDIPAESRMTITSEPDVQGWENVLIDGASSGRVRAHQRMKFRRD